MGRDITAKWTSRGTLEAQKFDYRRNQYYEYIDYLKNTYGGASEILEHFTSYVGHMSLHRVLTLYVIDLK